MPLATFLACLETALVAQNMRKLTLSKPIATDGLGNVYARLVQLKSGVVVQFTLRYAFKDVTKNLPPEAAIAAVRDWLTTDFGSAHLHTPEAVFTLERNKKGELHFAQSKNKNAVNTTAVPVLLAHNRPKNRYIVAENNVWLHRLGIATAQGEIRAAQQAKYKQIDKYVEIMAGLVAQIELPAAPRIADMGAGKGYLTFALYDYLSRNLVAVPHITGVEFRPEIVAQCNQIVEEAGFANLEFVAGTIDSYHAAATDILIALHACDTATDDAIAQGIRAAAQLIVVAPCCHKQVRKAMRPPENLQAVLQHGILLERQAELLTDGIRALLLEAHGYTTKVFEFISLEHTGKNVLITAVKNKKNNAEIATAHILAQINALKMQFGIAEHYLEGLLLGKNK
jgi:SAM-dependent methyltransferase